MTSVHQLRFNTQTKGRHVHISQSVTRSKLVSSASRFLSDQSSATTRSNAFRSIYPERRSDQLLSCTNTAKSCVTCVLIRSVIFLSWALQVIAEVRSVSVYLVIRFTLLASLLPLASWSICREKCSTFPPLRWCHSAFAPILMFTTNSDNCLYCTSDVSSIQQLCALWYIL